MVVENFKFTPLPEIYFGPGEFKKAVSLISRYGENVLLIVGGSSFQKSTYFKEFSSECSSSGLKISMASVTGEPSPGNIDSIVNSNRGHNPDVVIAIGGGSVLDAGKAVSAMLKVDDSVLNYLEGVGTKSPTGEKVPFIAVPTTSGTGSEMTKNAVITELGAFKKSLRHDNYIPDIAIVDPTLTLSCPKGLTAACGLDAFTQLLGAYMSTTASAFTDCMALDGIKAAAEGLVQSYENPGDIKARTAVSYASMLSGIVLANAGLGLVHGVAGPLGAVRDIPHGVACGTLLGEVIDENIKALKSEGNNHFLEKYKKVEEIVSENSDLVETIKSWIDRMGIKKLSEYGFTKDDFEDVVNASSLKNNPVKIDNDTILSILLRRL